MDLKQVRKTVGAIKTTLFKNANSFSVGMLKSHFRGTGLQFKEHRIYSFGDDVRFIDWKMLAKTDQPYIKTFEEERNVEIAVIVDASVSMLCGYKNVSKLQASIEICCLLMLLAKETSDNVTVLVIKDGQVVEIPKSNGEEGIARLINQLQRASIVDDKGKVIIEREAPKHDVTAKDLTAKLMSYLRRKREIVILSDLVELFDLNYLRRVLYQKNVHCFQILCPLDEKKSNLMGIFSFGSSGKSKYHTLNTNEVEDIEHFLGKKLKKLRVEERYLENFIKEMI